MANYFNLYAPSVVIDGWGIPSEKSPKDGDAITNANTPVMDKLSSNSHGFTELEASSLAVGLPEGLMGNSEVGHMNIGAGRVVWQDVVRIDLSSRDEELGEDEVIKKTFQSAASGNGRLHLCGLVSRGGVVSPLDTFSLVRSPRELTEKHVSTPNKNIFTLF